MLHSTVYIHLDRLKNNLAFLKEKLQPGVSQMAVIKADAYGHGAPSIARFLEDKVGWFATASIAEALELREAGVQQRILVFAPPMPETAQEYVNHRLTAVISHIDHFKMLPAGTDCHLQFDTGMERFGMYADQVPEIKQQMSVHSGLAITGIMTHYANATDPGLDTVEKQRKQFESIRSDFDGDLVAHTANSGGVLFYPDTHYDMVRHGIAMYGYPPGDKPVPELQPVMEWRSFVMQCKPIKKGAQVSYLGRWTCPEDGYIGVVPVGYGDGLPRNLTGKISFQIEDKQYPVVGIVTMDYSMVYLGRDQYRQGTPVIVMGHEGATAKEWGDKMDSISYEILCRINPRRVQRQYIGG